MREEVTFWDWYLSPSAARCLRTLLKGRSECRARPRHTGSTAPVEIVGSGACCSSWAVGWVAGAGWRWRVSKRAGCLGKRVG